ncbi:hypothetical protein A7982_13842 [Minicystis rosea]|nr:hypothetical protein A7982_13842 [Minicystis rosea]
MVKMARSANHPSSEPGGARRIELPHLLREGDGYIVGLNPEGEVDWQVTDELGIELEKQSLEWARVRHRVSQFGHAEVEHLSERQMAQLRRKIGAALVLAFELQLSTAHAALDDAARWLDEKRRDKARIWYLTGASSTLAVVGFAALAAWSFRDVVSMRLGPSVPETCVVCGAGALGAVASIFTRAGTMTVVNPSAGRALHHWESAGRVVVGSVAAFLASWLYQLELLLPPQSLHISSVLTAQCALGILAGFSERWMPSIVKRFEDETSPGNTPAPDVPSMNGR